MWIIVVIFPDYENLTCTALVLSMSISDTWKLKKNSE